MSKLIDKGDQLLILIVGWGECIKKLKAIFVQAHQLHTEPVCKRWIYSYQMQKERVGDKSRELLVERVIWVIIALIARLVHPCCQIHLCLVKYLVSPEVERVLPKQAIALAQFRFTPSGCITSRTTRGD